MCDKEFIFISKNQEEAKERISILLNTSKSIYEVAACEYLLYAKNPMERCPEDFTPFDVSRIVLYDLSKIYLKLKIVPL